MLLNKYAILMVDIENCLKEVTQKHYDKLLTNSEFVKDNRLDLKNPNVILFKLTKIICEVKLGLKYKMTDLIKLVTKLKTTKSQVYLLTEASRTIEDLLKCFSMIASLNLDNEELGKELALKSVEVTMIYAELIAKGYHSPIDRLAELFATKKDTK